MQKIYLILALIVETFGQTLTGCLKLLPNNAGCAVCDSMMNYVLSGKQCVLQKIPNCMISFDNQWCKICEYGYFLDGAFQCSKVQYKTFIEIQNCNQYVTVDRCLVCNLGTYVRNGVCRPIQTKRISGCTVNQDASTCSHCQLMLPSKDGKQCYPVPSGKFNNCMLFRHPLICTRCKPGYIYNPNYMILNIDSYKMYTAFFFQLKFWKSVYFSLLLNTPVCVQNYTIPFCQTLDYNQTCSKCIFGYTLSPDRTRCFVRPHPPRDPTYRIPFCYKFGSETYEVCKMCYEGYYLNTAKTACIKITNPVPNCIIHSQQYDSICIYCDNKYYLNSSLPSQNVCVIRTIYPVNCATFQRDQDICTSCMTGTMFHFNNQRCSSLIPNCLVYLVNDRVLKCGNCKNGYYLDYTNTICLFAHDSTPSCLIYTYGGTCIQCLQGYYLDATTSKCFQHDPFQGCSNLSLTTRSLCVNCTAQAINSAVINTCRQVPIINLAANCIKYDGTPQCTQCASGYLLYQAPGQPPSCIQVNGCVKLADVTNAKMCGQCADSSYFLWNGQCLTPDSKNCIFNFLTNSTSSTYLMTTGYPCQVCATGYFYRANSGSRTVVCNTYVMGTGCLIYYIPGSDITQSYCSRCYRDYAFNQKIPKSQNCSIHHVIWSSNSSALTCTNIGVNDCFQSAFMGALAWNLTSVVYYYHYSAANRAAMFPLIAFPTLPALTTANQNLYLTPSTICLQVSNDLNSCLACKPYYGAVYIANSWTALETNLVNHNRWVYNYKVGSKDYDELYYLTASPPVTHCRTSGTQNNVSSSNYPLAGASSTDPNYYAVSINYATYYVGGETYHFCNWAANFSTIWTAVYPDLTVSLSVTSLSALGASSWPFDWGTYRTAAQIQSWSAAYLKLFNVTCTGIDIQNQTAGAAVPPNCLLMQNLTDVISNWTQRRFLSCAKCDTSYSITTYWFRATIYAGDSVNNYTNKFVWIVNNCTLSSVIPSFMTINNCYNYNVSNQGNRLFFECLNCVPGSYPAFGLQPFQCSANDRYSDTSQPDGCKVGTKCSKYKVCKYDCGNSCTDTQMCNQTTNACQEKACTQCPDPNNPRCRTLGATCQDGWFCNWGVCQPICTCQNGEVCTPKTGMTCSPRMSGIYSAKDFREALIDYQVLLAFYAGTSHTPAALAGCGNGNIVEGKVCVPLSQCPVCPRNSYCRMRLKVPGVLTEGYIYECAWHPTCETCTGTQWCHSSLDYQNGRTTVVGCADSPQWTFPFTSANCTTCLSCWDTLADEVCVNGTNVRSLKNVCYFTNSLTTAAYCPYGKSCYNGACYSTLSIWGMTIPNCECAANQICVNFNCITPLCPVCPRDSFCNITLTMTGNVPTYVYGCIKSKFCSQNCGPNQFCHSSFNYTHTPNITVFDNCRPYLQYAFPDPNGDCKNNADCPTCTSCTADQQCVKNVCVDNVYDVCAWVGGQPVKCGTNQICHNSVCINTTSSANPAYIDGRAHSCTGSKKLFYKGTCYNLNDCPICAKNQYCSVSYDAAIGLAFVCVTTDALVCPETLWIHSAFDWVALTTTVSGCGSSPQWTIPYDAICTSTACVPCVPVCNATSSCVQGSCVPNLMNVCSFKGTEPVFCDFTEICIDSVCRKAYYVENSYVIDCGAVAGKSICYNNKTVATSMCPVCPQNQYCIGIKQEDGSFLFTCSRGTPVAACATCKGTTWCTSTFDFETNLTTPVGCANSPQFSFTYTALTCPTCQVCSPACDQLSTCANGVCVPILKNVCGFAKGSIPIICANYEICWNGYCFRTKSYLQLFDASLSASGCSSNATVHKVFLDGTCYTLNQCPLCSMSQTCKQSYVNNAYVYTCENTVPCTCSDGQFCWMGYDFSPLSVQTAWVPIGCRSYSQLSMDPKLVVPSWTPCSPACTASQSCMNGVCVTNIVDVCYFTADGLGVKCNANQTCIKDSCAESFVMATTKVSDAKCNAGEVYISGACYALTMCPICKPWEFCNVSYDAQNNPTFYCAYAPACLSCVGTKQFCQASGTAMGPGIDLTPIGVATCGPPTWAYTYTAATCKGCTECTANPCAVTAQCVNGVCIPIITTKICGFAFDGTVPFDCAANEFCIDERCMKRDIFNGKSAVSPFQIAIDGFPSPKYTLSECPICRPDQFCAGSADANAIFTYFCQSSSLCTCQNAKTCQSTWDYSQTPAAASASSVCGTATQLGFDPATAVAGTIILTCTGCTNPPTTNEICVNGTCLPVVNNACYWTMNGTVPVVCNNTQICSNGQCIDNYPNLVAQYPIYGFTGPSGTSYNSSMCPFCPPSMYCQGNIDSSGFVYYVCATDPECAKCTASQFCHGTFDYINKGTVANPPCGSSPQFGFGVPDAASPLAPTYTDCATACTTGFTCVNGTCFENMVNTCGFDNSNKTITCFADQQCVNQVCRDTYQLAFKLVVDCGCGAGYICYNSVCYRTAGCPVCNSRKYCYAFVANGNLLYGCKSSSVCNTCTNRTWCHSTFDAASQTSIPTGCEATPQFDLPNCPSTFCSACSNCPENTVCANGFCVPVISGVCSWAFFKTVPVICEANQICYKGVCLSSSTPAPTGCTTGQIFVEGACLTLTQCPICDRNKYCSATNTNGVVTYTCKSDPLCNACTGLQRCQASFNYYNSTSSAPVAAPNTCSNVVQLTFPWTFPTITVTTCPDGCLGDQQCVNGICMNGISKICQVYSNTVPIFCKPNDVCVTGLGCVNLLQWGSTKVKNSFCGLGTVFSPVSQTCHQLPGCQICHQKETCQATQSATYQTWYNCTTPTDTVASVCSGCPDDNYCQGTVTMTNNQPGGWTFGLSSTVCNARAFLTFSMNATDGTPSTFNPSFQSASGTLTRPGYHCVINPANIDGQYVWNASTTQNPCFPVFNHVCFWAFKNKVAVTCGPKQYCNRGICLDNTGSVLTHFTGCPTNFTKINGVCYPVSHCPVCNWGTYCQGSFTGAAGVGSYKFTCVWDSACELCSPNQWCHGDFDWSNTASTNGTVSTNPCRAYPQFTFPNQTPCISCTECTNKCTACTPDCDANSDCVDGACVPRVTTICYFNRTTFIPTICANNNCFKGSCVQSVQRGVLTVTDCGCRAGQICKNQICYEPSFYKKCPPNQISMVFSSSYYPTNNTSCACSGKDCNGGSSSGPCKNTNTTSNTIELYCTNSVNNATTGAAGSNGNYCVTNALCTCSSSEVCEISLDYSGMSFGGSRQCTNSECIAFQMITSTSPVVTPSCKKKWSATTNLDFYASQNACCGTCTNLVSCGGQNCVGNCGCYNRTTFDVTAAPFNPTLVCGYEFSNTVPYVCAAGQTCVNGNCVWNFNLFTPGATIDPLALPPNLMIDPTVPTVISPCGCPPNNLCVNQECKPLGSCIGCTQSQICAVVGSGPQTARVYTYSCIAATQSCPGTTYPTSSYNYPSTGAGTTTDLKVCDLSPQLGFSSANSVFCANACDLTKQYCTQTGCTPRLYNVCSWGFNGLVPIFCGLTETCVNNVCIKTCQPSCDFGFSCDLSTRTCVEMPTHTQKTIINACNQVANCGIQSNYSRTLNQCDRCADNFAFEINNSTTIDGVLQVNYVNRSNCVPAPVQCFVANITNLSPLTTSCFNCSVGYILVAGFCFSNMTNCTFSNSSGYCLACTYSYFNEYQYVTDGIFQTGSCIQFVAGITQPDNTPYSGATDVNCAYYSYFYAVGVAKPALLNAGQNFCVACKTGYFLNSLSACLPANIINCTNYDVTSTDQLVKCTQCIIGYSLSASNTSCVLNWPPPGQETLNCVAYFTNFSCSLCADNYVLGQAGPSIWGQSTFCYFNSTADPFCLAVDPDYFVKTGLISCQTCGLINGGIAYPFKTSTPTYMCLKISTVTNCLIHNTTLITNNQKCLKCKPNYYVNEAANVCILRTAANYPINNCLIYSNTSDSCEVFASASTQTVTITTPLPLADQILVNSPPISPLGNMIVDYGGWIMGCEVYSDNQTCVQCYAPRYLNPFGFDYNNKCLIAPVTIKYCSHYDSTGVNCLACQKFYTLVNGACVLIEAINCVTYASPSACATCPPTYPILNQNNCEIDYTNPWCLVWQNGTTPGKFDCVNCLPDFYPNDDGICQKVHNPVRNCLYYQFDGLCKTCNEGFYLQYDSKRCLVNPSWDQNCAEFNYGTECSVCDMGYVMINGSCVACQTDYGCMYCDPSSTSTCKICRFGFLMNANGSCTLSPEYNNVTALFENYRWMSSSSQSSLNSIEQQTPGASSILQVIFAAFWLMLGMILAN